MAVRKRINIDALVKRLGEYHPRGEWLNFRCPFHHGSKFNFGVNTLSLVYSCFACGERGSLKELDKAVMSAGAVPLLSIDSMESTTEAGAFNRFENKRSGAFKRLAGSTNEAFKHYNEKEPEAVAFNRLDESTNRAFNRSNHSTNKSRKRLNPAVPAGAPNDSEVAGAFKGFNDAANKPIKQLSTEGASSGGSGEGANGQFKYLERLSVAASARGTARLTPKEYQRSFVNLTDCGETETARAALAYLDRRGVDHERYGVGLLRHPDYRGRVVFPFRQGGRTVFFQGRSFVDIPLKTKNPSEEDGWLGKSRVLWRWDELIDRGECVLCEGIFDAASVMQKTGLQATCLLGTSISAEQIQLLKVAGIRFVYVFLDGDAMHQASRLAIKLYESGLKTSIVVWPDLTHKEDPGSIDKEEMNRLFNKSVLPVTHRSAVELLLEYS